MPLKFGIGGARDANVDPMECMGPASNPSHMVGLVGDRTHSFDTFVRVESRGCG